MERYKRIIAWVSAIIAILLSAFLWIGNGQYEISKRYPVKEEEWKSLENYALEVAKNQQDEIEISEEELARIEKDNYQIVERKYKDEKYFVKVKSEIAELEIIIPVSEFIITSYNDNMNLSMILNYNQATYVRTTTVLPFWLYIGMFTFIAAVMAMVLWAFLMMIGNIVYGVIFLIKKIIRK